MPKHPFSELRRDKVENLKKLFGQSVAFLKWVLVALLVGGICGVVGSLFHICIDLVTELRMEHGWVIFLLPVGGLAIFFLYKLSKTKLDTNRVIESIRSENDIPLIMAPLIFIGTVITHCVGGSAGREGAALQLGGSIGYNIGCLFRFGKDELHMIVMTGMSAFVAALFGTPLTAAFFALEVTSVGIMHYSGLVPCLVAAYGASTIAKLFRLSPVAFTLTTNVEFGAISSLQTAGVAIVAAIVSVLFCVSLEKGEHYMKKLVKRDWLRPIIGGVLIIGLTILVGNQNYNGAGMNVIESAMQGKADIFAFVLKIVFTVITIAAGFKGGEIVPTFFIGSTLGCVVAPLFGLDPAFGAAIGFVALFCGVVNCPVASIILALEVFGVSNLPLLAIACGISYMLSGNYSLYKSQKIMYSKFETKFINAKTK